jgi:hypothetical protein
MTEKDTLERYTHRLCNALKVEYSDVFGRGYKKRSVYWVRLLVCEKFRPATPLKVLSEFLGIAGDSISRYSTAFKKNYQNDYKFKGAVNYLVEIGHEGLLPTPPDTTEIQKSLDETLDHMNIAIAMLEEQKSKVYKIKESLPNIWEYDS